MQTPRKGRRRGLDPQVENYREMLLPMCRVENVKDKFTWAKAKAVAVLGSELECCALFIFFSVEAAFAFFSPRFLKGERRQRNPMVQKHDHTQVTPPESVLVVRVTFSY